MIGIKKGSSLCFRTRRQYATNDLANKEHFVDMEGKWRCVWMAGTIVDGGELYWAHFKPCFLTHLRDYAFTR